MPAGVHHEARVFKAGNSLAIRIPNALARYFDLKDGSAVAIGADDNVLYICKAQLNDLQELIDRITPENLHPSVVENLVGNERW